MRSSENAENRCRQLAHSVSQNGHIINPNNSFSVSGLDLLEVNARHRWISQFRF